MYSDEIVLRVAKTLSGPRDATHIGQEKLHELQDYSWDMHLSPIDRQAYLDQARAALAVLDAGDLDQRMEAKGMIPLSKLLESRGEMEKWMQNVGVNSLPDFVSWVKQHQKQYMEMRMRYEIGDKTKDDDLFEWVFAHSAVFDGIATQLRAVVPAYEKEQEAARELAEAVERLVSHPTSAASGGRLILEVDVKRVEEAAKAYRKVMVGVE